MAVSHPLPASFIFVCVSARLRYGFLSVYCGLFLSLEGSVGNVSTPGGRVVNGAFWAVLGSDLGGVGFFASTDDELDFAFVQARLLTAAIMSFRISCAMSHRRQSNSAPRWLKRRDAKKATLRTPNDMTKYIPKHVHM